MPSLLDIAPPEIAGKTVEIRGVVLTLRGIAAIDWAQLYARFPELRAIVAGRGDVEGADRTRMMQAQCALIAAGTGHAGSPAVEKAAMTNINSEEQTMLIQEIIALSNPGDVFSPLFDEGSPPDPGVVPSTKEPDTRSPKQLRH